MLITRTEMNIATKKQPVGQHNEEIHVKDQTDLTSVVRRLHAQVSKMQRHHVEEVVALQHKNAHLCEAHRLWHPKDNPHEGWEVESTTVSLPRATNLSLLLGTVPPVPQHFGKIIAIVLEPFCPQHHGSDSPFQPKKLDY